MKATTFLQLVIVLLCRSYNTSASNLVEPTTVTPVDDAEQSSHKEADTSSTMTEESDVGDLSSVLTRQECHNVTMSDSEVIQNCSRLILNGDKINFNEHVTSLDLSHNELQSSVIDNVYNLSNLRCLNVSHNKLMDGSFFFNNFKSQVNFVDFSYNLLKKFPVLSNSIETLQLENNLMEELILDELAQYKKLQHLTLKGNSIKILVLKQQKDLNFVSNLKYLDLSGNKLSNFIPFFRTLKYLNLSYNMFEELGRDTFNGLCYLETLDLSHNALMTVADDSFKMLDNLHYLYLSFNHLHTLPNTLPMMDVLDISFNQIRQVPEDLNHVLYPQQRFLIGGNPFDCNYHLLWLKEYFDTRKYILKYTTNIDREKFIPVCDRPKALARRSWDTLDDDDFKNGDEAETHSDKKRTGMDKVIDIDFESFRAADVTPSSINLNWKAELMSRSEEDSIMIQYHQFGLKVKVKRLILPVSVRNYRLRHLDPDTPYIVCISVLSEGKGGNSRCIEVMTVKTDSNEFLNILEFLFDNIGSLNINSFFVGLATFALCIICSNFCKGF